MQYSRQSYAGMSLYHSIANVTKDMGLHQLLLNLHSVCNCKKKSLYVRNKNVFFAGQYNHEWNKRKPLYFGFWFQLDYHYNGLEGFETVMFYPNFCYDYEFFFFFFNRPLIKNYSSFLHRIKNNAQKNQ